MNLIESERVLEMLRVSWRGSEEYFLTFENGFFEKWQENLEKGETHKLF